MPAAASDAPAYDCTLLLLCPCCAAGWRVQADLERVAAAGQGRVDITVGSALDIFGGQLAYADVVAWHNSQQRLVAAAQQ